LRRHVESLHHFYGEFMGVRIARKHVGWFLQHINNDPGLRKFFNGLSSAGQQLELIERIYESPDNEVLAA
jgi:tRNA-dihydrouridine synthase B